MSNDLRLDLLKPFYDLGIREGDEFEIDGYMYKIEDGKVVKKDCIDLINISVLFDATICDLHDQEITNIVRAPWKPKMGETYFVIAPFEKCGYSETTWDGFSYEKYALKRGVIYRTEDEAKAAAKELGWVE